jgi:DNA topoisomerase-1
LKKNSEGETVIKNEFSMSNGGEVEIHQVTKTFGAFKNKLQIQELGIQTIKLLIQYFPALFEYTYTSYVEQELDKIVDEEESTEILLKHTETLIDSYIVPLKTKMAKTYSIDEKYELTFGKSGAMMKRKGENSWISLKSGHDIDFIKLEKGEYRLEDLIENENKCLGIYENEEVVLKCGPYGNYVSWKDTTISLKQVLKKHSLENITLEMVTDLLLATTKNEKIIRHLDDFSSVRHSKHGNYIYYKTTKMKKPKFLGLTNCPHDVLMDEVPDILRWMKSQL